MHSATIAGQTGTGGPVYSGPGPHQRAAQRRVCSGPPTVSIHSECSRADRACSTSGAFGAGLHPIAAIPPHMRPPPSSSGVAIGLQGSPEALTQNVAGNGFPPSRLPLTN